jgi:hypothetical protein
VRLSEWLVDQHVVLVLATVTTTPT